MIRPLRPPSKGLLEAEPHSSIVPRSVGLPGSSYTYAFPTVPSGPSAQWYMFLVSGMSPNATVRHFAWCGVASDTVLSRLPKWKGLGADASFH